MTEKSSTLRQYPIDPPHGEAEWGYVDTRSQKPVRAPIVAMVQGQSIAQEARKLLNTLSV